MIPITKPILGEAEQRAASEVIASGWLTQGPKVAAFEAAFAADCGAEHAVAVSNCTTALHLALLAAGVQPGDEVICPSMSFIATANAVMHCGATPVFAEVCADDFNINPDAIEPLITPKTRAIMPVHQIGYPAKMQAITRIAGDHNLAVVEDAACAVGSDIQGQRVGKPWGASVCFSFHPRKVLTMGEGGMITTDDQATADKLRLLRQHGMSVPDTARHASKKVIQESYLCVGYNYRMTDIQAAIGIEQLKRLASIVENRQRLAARYNEALGSLKGLAVPIVEQGVQFNYQSYAIRLSDDAPISRDDLMQKLLDQSIATRRGIMTIHREPAYADHCQATNLPVSEAAADTSILLPLYPQMTLDEQDQVIKAIQRLWI